MRSGHRWPVLAALLAVLAAAPFFMVAEARGSIVFIGSDPADYRFYKALGLDAAIYLGCNNVSLLKGADTVYVPDFNWQFCGGWPRGLGEKLFSLARSGATVVVGLNTLYSIKVNEPGTLERYGISLSLQRPATGYNAIHVELPDMEGELFYPSQRYLRAVVVAPPSRVYGWFDDGLPAIVDVELGRGRLVILAFNPVWPWAEGLGDAYVVVVAAAARQRVFPVATAMLAASATAVTAAGTASQGLRVRGRRLGSRIVGALALLGYQVRGEDALRHPVRKRILSLLEERPYATVGELVVELNASRTSILWHLGILERVGVVGSEIIAGKTIYFLKGKRREAILAFLAEAKVRRMIIEVLSEEQPLTLTKLALRIGVSKSTVKHHLDTLRRYGVVVEAGTGYRLAEWARRIMCTLALGGGGYCG